MILGVVEELLLAELGPQTVTDEMKGGGGGVVRASFHWNELVIHKFHVLKFFI